MAIAWFVLQASATVVWWLSMTVSDRVRRWFELSDDGDVLSSFVVADLVVILLGSTSACALPIGGVVLWSRGLRPPEERFLVERFGAPYERYRRTVPLWRPTWPPYRG